MPPCNMPLSETGKEILAELQKKHGELEGKQIFYASIQAGVPGSEKWEGPGRKSQDEKDMHKQMKDRSK